jgi:phage N-6-adenine-methyltransferase
MVCETFLSVKLGTKGTFYEMTWTTPQRIFDALNAEFHFAVDLYADIDNHKVDRYFPRETSLSHTWDGKGWAWLNPPYGREISDWTKKAIKTNRGIVGFLPGRTNAPWWHDHVMRAWQLRFVWRKVSFANTEGCKGVPPWGSVVVIWDPNWRGINLWPACTSWDWRNSGE